MQEEVLVPKHLLKHLYELLNKFEYDPADADESTSEFTGYVSEDWFFHLKNQLEKIGKWEGKDNNRGAEINAHALRINADKLIAVTEQRDRLAEACQYVVDSGGNFSDLLSGQCECRQVL